MNEHDSGGKRGGGGKDKGSSFWDHARTVGQGVLEGLLGSGSTSVKRSVARNDPMAAERTAAAKQIHRSLKAWRDRAADGEAVQRKPQIPSGGGNPLPGGLKSKMEGKLGADFSDVKIHTGGDSEKASEDLNAKAFTVGNDVHFGSGQFDPSSKEGEKLVSHELTHVVQGQRGGVQRKEDDGGEEVEGADGEALDVSDPDEPAEREADEVSEKAVEEHGEAQPKAQAPLSIAAKLKGVFRKIFRSGGTPPPTLSPQERTMLNGMVGGPDLLAKLGKVAPDKEASLIQEAKIAIGEALAGGAQVMIGHVITTPGATKALTEIDVETADTLIQVKGGNYTKKRKLSDDDMDQLTNTKRYNEKMRLDANGKKLPPKKLVYCFTAPPIHPELEGWLKSKGVNEVRLGAKP